MIKIKTIYILFICILFGVIFAQECNRNGLRRFDANVAKLITIGNSGRKFPETKGEQLKKYCDQSYEYTQDIEKFRNKCMKDLAKQVSGVLVFSVKNTIKQLCKKDSKRLSTVIASATCANAGNAEINKCYTNLIDSFLGARHAADKKKIPHICCEYHKLFDCLKLRLKRIEKCTEKHIETINDFAQSIAGNAVNVLCGDYTDGSDKCSKLESPPKKKKSQIRSKSFALPMIEVMESFAEQ